MTGEQTRDEQTIGEQTTGDERLALSLALLAPRKKFWGVMPGV